MRFKFTFSISTFLLFPLLFVTCKDTNVQDNITIESEKKHHEDETIVYVPEEDAVTEVPSTPDNIQAIEDSLESIRIQELQDSQLKDASCEEIIDKLTVVLGALQSNIDDEEANVSLDLIYDDPHLANCKEEKDIRVQYDDLMAKIDKLFE